MRHALCRYDPIVERSIGGAKEFGVLHRVERHVQLDGIANMKEHEDV
jgi:hypothetical protein